MFRRSSAVAAGDSLPTSKRGKRLRRYLVTFMVPAVAALSFLMGTAAPAQAGGWWSPVLTSCGSKIVQLNFDVAYDYVWIGKGNSASAAGTDNDPWTLYPGSYVINTGETAIWWQVYASPGAVTGWSYSCVSYY